MSHTADQEKIVIKILSLKQDQYYEILQVEKSASDNDIKKSYRKLAIKLHPDKNPHPRASEAFKSVNKAWGVLSDPAKKRIFDQTGQDPESRTAGYSSGSSASPFAGGTPFAAGGDFSDDIFNMFFGGGMPRGQTFTFNGGPGFTFHSFGDDPFVRFSQAGPRQRRRPQQQQRRTPAHHESTWDTVKQLLPIMLILFVSLISTFFAEDSTPDYSFTRTGKFNVRRETPTHSIPFYVKKSFTEGKSARNLLNFDRKVELLYIKDVRNKCSQEKIYQTEQMDEAHGWFSTDEKKLREAQNMVLPNCDRLGSLGLL